MFFIMWPPRPLWGGGPKDDMMTRGRGGLDNPQNDDVIYEQPLTLVTLALILIKIDFEENSLNTFIC